MNESFWDAQNVEIETGAIFEKNPGLENVPSLKNAGLDVLGGLQGAD